MPAPIKAVVFDMDGLLVDTERVLFDAMVEVAPAFNVTVDLPLFQRLIGLPIGPSGAILQAEWGESFALADFIETVRQKATAKNRAGVALKAGVMELLDLLDARKTPYALCTSSAPETVAHHLGQYDLHGRFASIVAKGDYTHGKPHPEPFLTAAARLGIEPASCLALEDSHNGVRSAHAAGMRVVMVPDMLEANDEIRGLCLAITATLHEIEALITAQDPG